MGTKTKNNGHQKFTKQDLKDGHTNIDVNDVVVNEIPDFDLLAWFPCQDYSAAKTSQNSKGLIGKKVRVL